MTAPANLISLAAVREALARRFPEALPPPERYWATGWAAIDGAEGGLKQGAVTEVCSALMGGGLFLDGLLASFRERRSFAGLVDCGRTFDPGSYAAGALARVLCVACSTAEEGVKAADLLLRDGNLPVVLLDLQALPRRSLARIPANTWHRFQRLVEKSGTVFLVLTPQPIVEAARVRITLRGEWNLAALQRPRHELVARLGVQISHRGRQRVPAAEPLVQTA
jgi:hypothetical protein